MLRTRIWLSITGITVASIIFISAGIDSDPVLSLRFCLFSRGAFVQRSRSIIRSPESAPIKVPVTPPEAPCAAISIDAL